MKKRSTGFIRDLDIFGHTINLNFMTEGDKHRTLIGGLMSLVVRVLIFLFVVNRFVAMVTGGRDNVATASSSIEDIDTVKVTYADLNMTAFHYFSK